MTTLTVSGPRPSPLPSNVDDNKTQRLPEGWHFTERWGEVFITPGGSAWVVRQNGEHLINGTVTLNPYDITKTPVIDRVKHAQAMRRYRRTRVSITPTPNLPLSEAEGVDK